MKTLHVYPTARAIRSAKALWREQDGLVPDFMQMDAFEARAVSLGDRVLVDPLWRVLLLREAADFGELGVFGLERALVKFFARSEGVFRFFEELGREEVEPEELAQADAYAEFGAHIAVLGRLRERYARVLEERGLTDTMFVPRIAQVHAGFVRQYARIEIFLEGMLSRYEMRLLEGISAYTQLVIHFVPTPYSDKMLRRLRRHGLHLPPDRAVTIEMHARTVTPHDPAAMRIRARTVAVGERYDQIAEALAQIDRMVRSGIAPERIALILPDESLKEPLRLYDTHNNLNFAMGFDYTHGRSYAILDALSRHLHVPDPLTRERLERYGITPEQVATFGAGGSMDAEGFMARLEVLGLRERDPLRIARVEEAREVFVRLMRDVRLGMAEWLPLWMRQLAEIRIDDLRGGTVTVMGVLETRGVGYEGVVIVDFNDGIVPATVTKDQFLNSQVRAFADLPTRSDREALQKHYYHRLLSQARDAVILYATSDDRLASKFLYEMGLESAEPVAVQRSLLYAQPSRIVEETDPVVEAFDATTQIWSASRLSTWLGCRRKYYYRYIRGIESKPDTELNEGAFLHTLLEHLYRTRDHYDTPEALREQLHRLMDELLPDETPRIAYLKILFRRKLEPFIAHQIAHFRSGWRVVEREKEFTGTINGLHFKGRIDRIDQDAVRTLVIDYKSGTLSEANRAQNLEETTDFQMNIYRHLLAGRYGDTEPVFWRIFEPGDLVPARALDEKDTLLDAHIRTLQETCTFTAQKTDKLHRCTYCPYALICGRGEYL